MNWFQSNLRLFHLFLDFIDLFGVVWAPFKDFRIFLLQDILCFLQRVSFINSIVPDLHLSLVNLRHERMGLRGVSPEAAGLFEDPSAVNALEHAASIGFESRLRRLWRFLDLLGLGCRGCDFLFGRFHLLWSIILLAFSKVFSPQRHWIYLFWWGLNQLMGLVGPLYLNRLYELVIFLLSLNIMTWVRDLSGHRIFQETWNFDWIWLHRDVKVKMLSLDFWSHEFFLTLGIKLNEVWGKRNDIGVIKEPESFLHEGDAS